MTTKASTAASGIDPRGEDVALSYVGPGVLAGIPAADLNGGAINRVAYHRAHARALTEHEQAQRRWAANPAGDPPVLDVPIFAPPADLEAAIAELEASGFYVRTTTKSAPAAEPEG